MQLKDAMHAMAMRGNFGLKSFYPKIEGHVFTPKFGSKWESP
jgi:hypothetical protein